MKNNNLFKIVDIIRGEKGQEVVVVFYGKMEIHYRLSGNGRLERGFRPYGTQDELEWRQKLPIPSTVSKFTWNRRLVEIIVRQILTAQITNQLQLF